VITNGTPPAEVDFTTRPREELELIAEEHAETELGLQANVELGRRNVELGRRGSVAKEADVQADANGIGQLAADVEAEPIEWLWSRRVPLGELTILDGDPGTGKSTLLAAVAAHLTTGRGLPDHEGTPKAGGVVYVTTEDSPARTLRPRLEAAGANLRRVLLVPTVLDEEGDPRPLMLPDDVPLLGAAIDRVDARLVVIDPLMAHLGSSINAHRDSDVRRALAPLADLAHRAGAAVVVVRHLNKSGGTAAIYRGGGSIGIIGAARVGLLLGEHPEDEEARVLAPVKNNLAVFPPAQQFALEQAPDHDVARVDWLETCSLTADDLLRDGSGRGRPDGKKEEARNFLREILADGPVPKAEIAEAADEEGIAMSTLKRAKKALDVEAEKKSFDGSWRWRLPDDEAPF
jgi:energy-coupling factor transporter ATP-binding protein EcfA2